MRLRQKVTTKYNNQDATKLLKSLYTAKRPIGKKRHEFENETLQKAIEIYSNIDGRKNHYVINTMLNLCININKAENASLIWNDIEPLIEKDLINYPVLLKWCIKTNNFEKGKEIHSNLTLLTHKNDPFIQCSLINFYGHFGDVESAKKIFYETPNRIRNDSILNSMMTCYSNNDLNDKCLILYEKYPNLHDDTSHSCAIKACINNDNKDKGIEIINKYIDHNSLSKYSNGLLNTLINFYGKYGKINSAKNIFIKLSNMNRLDKYSVNSMIKLFVNNNKNNKALKLYDQYNKYDIFIDDISNILALQACMNLKDKKKGYEIISKIDDNNKNKRLSIELETTLMKFYSQFNDLSMCQSVFDGIPDSEKNVISVNCMIQSCVDNDWIEYGLQLFDQYYSILINNPISHILALNACIKTNNFDKGKDIHSKTKISKYLDNNVMLKTHLIEFYGYFGDIDSSNQIFDDIPDELRDVICISAMMKCFVNNHYNNEALDLYYKYHFLQNDISHLLAIKACSKLENQDKGNEIINSIKHNQANWSNELRITIVDFYGHFAYQDNASYDAFNIFNSIPDQEKKIDAINVMMNVYCNCDQNMQCIELFKSIPIECKPDIITYNTVIKACTQGNYIEIGKKIHQHLKNSDENHILMKDKSIVISLINMYSEFGMLNYCQDIFNDIDFKEIEIWNTMIHCYGKNGNLEKVKELYQQLKNNIFQHNYNDTTYTVLINACSHCGDDEFAYNIWQNDINDEQIKYNCYVITALVDCNSRKGKLNQALDIIINYENIHGFESDNNDNKAMWMSVLSACVNFQDSEMAEKVYNEFKTRFSYNDKYMLAADSILSNINSSSTDL